MAPKSSLFLFAILAALAVAVPTIAADTAAAPRSPKLGRYQPIANPNARAVRAVAKFALVEHNREKKSTLFLVSVVKGEWQLVVAGVNYRLVISALDSVVATTAPKTYTVVVHKNLKGALSLVSFQ